MSSSRAAVAGVFLTILTVGCGSGEDAPAADIVPLADVTSAASGCALAFSSSESFTAHQGLIFDFDYPAGWQPRLGSEGQSWHGYVSPPGNERIGIEYMLTPGPTDPEAMAKMREATMEPGTAVEYAGDTVQIYRRAFSQTSTVSLGMVLPHRGAHYDVVIQVRGGADCDMASIEAVGDLVVRSLRPNDDTVFAVK
jgi:hypothetical protein